MSQRIIQSWILDYACCHHFESVIHDISKRTSGQLESLDVCQSRIACSTIYFIVHKEQLSCFDTVIIIIEQLYKDIPENLNNSGVYSQLITGFKIKSLFYELENNINNSLLKLNTYFPRVPTIKENKQLSEKYRNFRKFFLSLVANKNQRISYLNNEYNSDFGAEFMKDIKGLTDKFLNSLEAHLGPPIIDLLLVSDTFQALPILSPETEMLLDFICDVKYHQKENEESEETKEEETLKFKEQDLLRMLSLLCPLDPEEVPSIDHHINLTRWCSSPILSTKETSSDQTQPLNFDQYLLLHNQQESREPSPSSASSTTNNEESWCTTPILSTKEKTTSSDPTQPQSVDQYLVQHNQQESREPSPSSAISTTNNEESWCTTPILSTKEKTTSSDQTQPQTFYQYLVQHNQQESRESSPSPAISTPNNEEYQSCNEEITSTIVPEINVLNLEPDIQRHSELPLENNFEENYPKSLCVCKLPKIVKSNSIENNSFESDSSHEDQIENISARKKFRNCFNSNNDSCHYSDPTVSVESDIFQSLSDSSDSNDNFNVVCPPGSESAQIFYCGNPFNIDTNNTCSDLTSK